MRILASASAPRAHSECAPDSMDALWAHSGSHGCAWGALQPGRTPGALRLACGHCERIPARTIAFGAHSGRVARMVILWAHCGSDERTRSAVPLSLLPSQASPFCICKKVCFVKGNKSTIFTVNGTNPAPLATGMFLDLLGNQSSPKPPHLNIDGWRGVNICFLNGINPAPPTVPRAHGFSLKGNIKMMGERGRASIIPC